MNRRPRLRSRLTAATAIAIATAAALAGCASSNGKTGPAAKAITGTWNCRVDGDRDTRYNFSGDRDPFSFYGGDEYTITVTNKRFTLTGTRYGEPVKAKGIWGVDYRSTKRAIGLVIAGDDTPNDWDMYIPLPHTITRDDARLTKDQVGLEAGLDENQGVYTVSASHITFEDDGTTEYSGGKPYAVRCSR